MYKFRMIDSVDTYNDFDGWVSTVKLFKLEHEAMVDYTFVCGHTPRGYEFYIVDDDTDDAIAGFFDKALKDFIVFIMTKYNQ